MKEMYDAIAALIKKKDHSIKFDVNAKTGGIILQGKDKKIEIDRSRFFWGIKKFLI